MTTLRDITTTRSAPDDASATVVKVRPNGTVDVDLGGGQIVESVPVLESTWTPASGVTVALLRTGGGRRLVLGPVRTANATTVTSTTILRFPYNVTPASSGASSLVVPAVATKSYRQGWERDDIYQGAYSTGDASAYGYWSSCYFPGVGAFATVAGRKCISLTIRVSRTGAGGATAATPQWIGPHVHPTQPVGAPLFPWGAINAGSLAWNAAAELALPPEWGDLLISGQAAGFGHLLRAVGSGSYSIAKSVASDPLSGRITMGLA